MGVLAPIFLAGLAALSLPVLWHLIRRTPRGRHEFSSLMFLTPSPPRLTRRSRLDQILLLLLRLGALALLAFAFARPFVRETSLLSLGDLPPRRVAILVDNSASMRRGELWTQAKREVERQLADLTPQDDVALYTFSDKLETVSPFAAAQGVTSIAGVEAIRQRLATLEPTWAASDLGACLSLLATELDAATDVAASHDEPQIVLVSDFQKGSRIDALQAFEWPKRVQIVTCSLATKDTTNAYPQIVASEEDTPQDPRVRVATAANSVNDQFYLSWADRESARTGDEVAVYVPPGQSRVVRLPLPEIEAPADRPIDRVVLRGDDHEFDNTYYVVTPPKQEVRLLYAGKDAADEPLGLQYYLRLATTSDFRRQVEVQPLDESNLGRLRGELPPQLVVCSQALSPSLVAAFSAYVEAGGNLLLVAGDQPAATALAALFPDMELVEADSNKRPGEFALLGEIDFSHPLFSALANPRYSDFTKIHFWRHRPVKLKESTVANPDKADNTKPGNTKVVARFDDGDPWIIERVMGRGRVIGLTSGWHPDDSQLALSSKFVALIGGLLDQACGATVALASVVVGERVPLTPRTEPQTVLAPDGRESILPAGASSFEQTDRPGVYRISSPGNSVQFGVNVAGSESDTAVIDLEQLKQLGLPIGGTISRDERLARLRQERDTELESRQKMWRWLLVGCLGFLIAETWWAGRASQLPIENRGATA